jgi:cytochrome d ubiquinol oxidase subunit II
MNPFDAATLPLVFAGLLGLSILIYVILDGFDLGVGILLPQATPEDRDTMIASVGPFWDANETWLVMAIGILLVAFPAAHGAILGSLYLPVAVMLIGLILRGVAFEFRVKAPAGHKAMWERIFFGGSLATALAQGFMLGLYVMGLDWTIWNVAFAALTGVCLAVAYSFIGSAWLIVKTEGLLQDKAVDWAKRSLIGVVTGLAAVSAATPFVSTRIFDKWFAWPEVLWLSPMPVASLGLVAVIWLALRHLPERGGYLAYVPFSAASLLFLLGFLGMAYSFFPFIVPDRLTIAEAASAPESLRIILWGVVFVLPAILGYTALSYRIFRGKAVPLSYE